MDLPLTEFTETQRMKISALLYNRLLTLALSGRSITQREIEHGKGLGRKNE